MITNTYWKYQFFEKPNVLWKSWLDMEINMTNVSDIKISIKIPNMIIESVSQFHVYLLYLGTCLS